MAIKLKHIIFYLGLWIITVSSAYYFGTMHPNQKLLVDLKNNIALEIQKDYAQHKFFEPEIVYNDNETFMRAVNSCVDFVNLTTPPADRIHKDIIVAMAVIESGYGTSRFAIQGNNLFGIRTWNKNEAQMKPKDNPDAEWGVKTYITKCKSIADMISILNRLKVYNPFRIERQRQLEEGIVDLDRMINLLSAWSTNPKYTALVKEKAKQSAELFSKN